MQMIKQVVVEVFKDIYKIHHMNIAIIFSGRIYKFANHYNNIMDNIVQDNNVDFFLSHSPELDEDLDIHKLIVERLSIGGKVSFIICDEAQFYSELQIEQLAKIVDGLGIDVYAFGILADFRTKLFPGSARLVELADRVQTLQVEALCWCGERATHNARTVDGKMVTEGEQVVVGDVGKSTNIAYEVLCRRHHMRKVTARVSNPAAEQSLPFNN